PVPALDPLVVLPAQRGERHDPGVQPRVADLGDPPDLRVALLAADGDLVDPGTVQLPELVEATYGPLLQLGPRADHVQAAARTRVERQREAEVALPRDVPVAHVAEPVVHPLLVLRRRPFDAGVRLEHRLADLVRRDEPVVDDAEDERCVAAPAGRIAVLDPAGVDHAAPL